MIFRFYRIHVSSLERIHSLDMYSSIHLTSFSRKMIPCHDIVYKNKIKTHYYVLLRQAQLVGIYKFV